MGEESDVFSLISAMLKLGAPHKMSDDIMDVRKRCCEACG